MVIKYRLGFADKSEDYAYICTKILDSLDAKFNVVKTDDEIIIFIEGEEEEIKKAFVSLGENLPLSLYLNAQSVEDAMGLPQNKTEFKKISYLTISPNVARGLVDESSEHYFDAFATSSGQQEKLISVDGKSIGDKNALKDALYDIANKIANGKKIHFKNERNSFTLSNEVGDSVFLTNLKSETISGFSLNNDDVLTLSSMERPAVLKLDTEREKFTTFIFANDSIMLLLARALIECGINAVYVSDITADVNVEYIGFLGDAPTRKALYFAGADRFFVNSEFTPDGPLVSANSIFFEMSLSDSFGTYAINENKNVKKLLGADFFTSNPIDAIASEFDFGVKLSSNFTKAFPDTSAKLAKMHFSGNAIADFFNAASIVTGKENGFESLIAMANKTDIAGGVKLDFTLQKVSDKTVAGLKKCFASLLSYKLAGVEDSILAYSVFESAVDFIVSTLDETKKSFTPSEMFVGGDFLLSKTFVAKLKSKVKSININMALNAVPANLRKSFEIVS